jgi:geranylgeranyl pyrophosphate synthase
MEARNQYIPIHIKLQWHIFSIDNMIKHLIDIPKSEDSKIILLSAMRYAVLSGGKRYRSFFLQLVGEMFSVSQKKLLILGSVIEMIHAYMIIHDDLPIIDNDDYRRGKLSCHKKYDESTTLIAGNALLTFAFEIIASNNILKINKDLRCEMIQIIAQHSGKDGMLNGQIMSIMFKKKRPSKEEIMRLNKLKTCSLFIAAAQCAGVLCECNQKQLDSLKSYAVNLGMLMKIYNDIEYCNKEHLFGRDRGDMDFLISNADLLTSQSEQILQIFEDTNTINKSNRQKINQNNTYDLCNFAKFILDQIKNKASYKHIEHPSLVTDQSLVMV